MKEPGERYDIAIIGSGLGGLSCAYMLGKEGYKVCVLEKNKQFGGNLQVFIRDGCVFDTGVHYIGGLAEGQNLNQFFKYFGIMDKLKLKQMDMEGFDRISFGDEEQEYPFAQGYDRFIERLVEQFPKERKGIEEYCRKVREFCRAFPLYNVESGDDSLLESGGLEVNAREMIASCTSDPLLQQVLAGNNGLYAGDGDRTPFYIHAMVVNTYIESAWRCIRGGHQIGKFLMREIRKQGGELYNGQKVEKIEMSGKYAKGVRLHTGRSVKADQIISNAHPAATLELLDPDSVRNAYKKRIKSLKNTISAFSLHIVLKDKTLPYFNHNYYHFDEKDVWNAVHNVDSERKGWPHSYILVTSASAKTERDGYAESLTIMCYMSYEEVRKWENSFNTIAHKEDRGEDYQQFKERKCQQIIQKIEKKFPGLRNKIYSYYSTSPLSYRDYIGTEDGNMYGILKDHKEPLRTFISPRTRVPNLLLTGENTNVHGVLGVTVGAVVTCSQLLGKEYLVNKIKKAT